MKGNHVYRRYAAIALLLLLAFGFDLLLQSDPSLDKSQRTPSNLPAHTASTSPAEGEYLVTRVIDGDTIEIAIEGEKEIVRYIGIDTPETVHPRKPVECFGAEAARKNKELAEGRLVRIERDVSDRDTYGRLLRYVYAGEIFINRELVANGYAYAVTFPPDVKYSAEFKSLESTARLSSLGLWGSSCRERL